MSEKTALLPSGWKKRLIPIKNKNTKGVTGWCLETHDLIAGKYAAGRKRDYVFCKAAIDNGLIDKKLLLKRLKNLKLPKKRTDAIMKKLKES